MFRRHAELWVFCLALAAILGCFFARSLFGGRVLSAGDTLLVGAAFADARPAGFEPANKLLIDSALQFQPWIEFNRALLRRGRLPLWNDLAGLGAPHLANSQSAVFDPFHLIAYLGRPPQAFAWIAALRLWFTGVGAWLLAKRLGMGPCGRWFSGLCWPFCGFNILWLMFPVASASIWLPWLILTGERARENANPRTIAQLAIVTSCVIVSGHIQTSALVLIAGAMFSACMASRRGVAAWCAGVLLGFAGAAVAIVPLGFYLAKSEVWSQRAAERAGVFTITKPKALDMVVTAFPYAYGSQKRGDPNLARALGVRNLNEAGGGFSGLACLSVLAPTALFRSRRRNEVVRLALTAALGLMAAFDIPPVQNLLRIIPVVNVMDQRRWTLWVSFGLVFLGGFGVDALARGVQPIAGKGFAAVCLAIAALAFSAGVAVFAGDRSLEPRLERWILNKDREPAQGQNASDAGDRAASKAKVVLAFGLRSLIVNGADLAILGALVLISARWKRPKKVNAVAIAWVGLNLLELLAFGWGYNPEISPEQDKPESALVNRLRSRLGASARVLGIGEEFPPNSLMRFGLADPRNYDSIELKASLDWWAPLYEPEKNRSSRAMVTWTGVLRALDRLEQSGVSAVVAATPPPSSARFAAVEKVGSCWVAYLNAEPALQGPAGSRVIEARCDSGRITLLLSENPGGLARVLESFDHGFRARVDGKPARVKRYRDTFMEVELPAGSRELVLEYDPAEVRAAGVCSLASLLFAVSLWVGGPSFQKKGPGSWKGRNDRIRMDSSISSRDYLPANH